MSNYPGGIDSFTSKVDNQDTILANDINELQEAIENVETELGTDPAGEFSDVAERLDDIDDQIEDITVQDTNVNLSDGNMGDHDTLEEHVKDTSIHGDLDALAYNYPQMLDKTLDQLQRGVLTSAYPLNTASIDATYGFPLEEGDVVYCYPVSNPSSSCYDWFMVTTYGTNLASTSSLRLNNEDAAPLFADNSRITRLQPIETFPEDETEEIEMETGSLVFAHPTENPSSSSYDWLMATADASGSSEIELNDEDNYASFATDSPVSVFEPTDTAPASDSSMPIALGDIVFCYPSSNPSGDDYDWHIVTASSSAGVAGANLRLDGEPGAPVFSGSQFSKFIVTGTAPCNDTSMPINQGDLAFCYTEDNPSSSSYDWHIVTVASLGVSSSAIRLDSEDYPPVYSSGSRFSRLTSERYQGVAQGGEILDIVYVPTWVILNSVGTGTDPESEGTAPSVYGNISKKFPMSEELLDCDFAGESLKFAGAGDPLTSSAFRPRVPLYSGYRDGYYPEAGMRIELLEPADNGDEEAEAERGICGAGIINRRKFGDLCDDDDPIIKAYTGKLDESAAWLCYLPVVARVLDNADNSQIDVGEFVITIIASQGESDSPYISTKDENTNAVDMFKIPSTTIYTGTGDDGSLVIDGSYASNSSNGIAYPGGQLSTPSNLAGEDLPGGSFSSGSSYYYRITAVDSYGNETAATDQFCHTVASDSSAVKLTWDPSPGSAGYKIYGRSNGDTKYMNEVSSEEYTDDNTDTPNPNINYPTSNSSDATYHIDTIKSYINITVQNSGVISCTDWDYDKQAYGKIVIYAEGAVLVDSSSKITATGKGYRGGNAAGNYITYQGESYTGPGTTDTTANAGGGGSWGGTGGAGGGGYDTEGETTNGEGGETYGYPTLDVLYRGSGGGAGQDLYVHGPGGNGGGIIMISADRIIIQGNGSIQANGNDGVEYGGGGSGGSIYLRANNLDLGINRVTAKGGDSSGMGGDGGEGRIRFDFSDRGPSESDPTAYKYQL